jgi:hypothetical protein
VLQVLHDFLVENASLPPNIHNSPQLSLDINRCSLVSNRSGIGNERGKGIEEILLVASFGLLYNFWKEVSDDLSSYTIEIQTVRQIDHVEPLRAREIFQFVEPQVDRLGCMSSTLT